MGAEMEEAERELLGRRARQERYAGDHDDMVMAVALAGQGDAGVRGWGFIRP